MRRGFYIIIGSIIVILISCRREGQNAVLMLRLMKRLPAEQQARISFGRDTIKLYGRDTILYARNHGSRTFRVASIVGSYSCLKACYNKQVVSPGDSLRIFVRVREKENGAAITLIGNLRDGQQTVHLIWMTHDNHDK